jgi:5-methylcytosine-specific restriction enzyme A
MAKTRQAGSPPWSRDELILALDLYLRFAGNPPGKAAREVVELSNILNQIGTEITARTAKYRNPNGVYMKIMNLRRGGCASCWLPWLRNSPPRGCRDVET